MKFIHTADLHLKKDAEQRIVIFKWLIENANKLEVDYFIIAGDLFESDTDATILRPKLKEIFESARATFLIIPGNHDAQSFSHDYDYGKNVIQLIDTPFRVIKHDYIKICGVPYQDKKFGECIKLLPDDVDILIAHGTLYDEEFIYSMLDDEETKYMPIFPVNLENKARYAALGHLHSRMIQKQYKNTKVVYPGSPVALDTKCDEERIFPLVTIDKKHLTVDFIAVESSPYWFRKEFFVFPGNEEKNVRELESFLSSLDGKKHMPLCLIKGFIGAREKDFLDTIEKVKEKMRNRFANMSVILKIQSWDVIIQNRMVKNFVEKTKTLDDELRMKILEITLPIYGDVLK